jgi:tetratricopeptide (TPR) repeat protein
MFDKPLYRSFLISCMVTCFVLLHHMNSVAYPQNEPSPHQKDDVVIDSLKQQLIIERLDSMRVKTLLELAIRLNDEQVYEANQYGTEALALADSLDLKSMKGNIYFTLGNNALNKTDYKNALLFYFKALRHFEALNLYEPQLRILNNIGTGYVHLKKYDITEKYYQQALAIRKEHAVNKMFALEYINLGFISDHKQNYPLAVAYFKKALNEAQKNKNDYAISLSLINLGDTYLNMKEYEFSKKYYQQALALNKKDNEAHHLSYCYMMVGHVERLLKNYSAAEKDVMAAKELAEQSGLTEIQTKAYNELATIFELRRDYKRAFQYHKLYQQANDSALNESNLKQIFSLQKDFELSQKDKEIQLLNKDKQLVEGKVNRERIIRNFFIAALILILVVTVVLMRNIRLKHRLNTVLNQKNIQVEKENKMLTYENISSKYEVLKSKVDPHFLFNSLSTLSSVIAKDKDMAQEFIDKFSSLYRMILETGDHKLISLKEEMKVVEHYLYLQKVRFGNNLIIEVNVNKDPEQYVIPPFAIQMLVENSIKHNIISRLRKLTISIYTEEEVLIVKNNLQPKQDHSLSTSTGQRSINERYQMIANIQPEYIETETAYIVKLPLLKAGQFSETTSEMVI